MFSCYTDTLKKDGDGNLVAKAMNGKDMTNNPYFGAEAEYILWGNDSVTKNLQSTRAMIFGIRFALNAVYAFTSTDTTAGADGGHSHRRLDGLRRAHRKDGDPAGVGHGGVLRGRQGPLRRGKGRGAV